MKSLRKNSGFTLIELLVVIAIIAILGRAAPASFGQGQDQGPGHRCMNNTNQMIKGFHLYAGDEEDYIPPNHDDGNSSPWKNWCSGQCRNPSSRALHADRPNT